MNAELGTFDPIAAPLRGVTLIEASAGTGKTFTISRLYLRLVVELGLTVNRILVVTFTQAATEELKTRIREMLKDALQRIVSESGFARTISALPIAPADAARRVGVALSEFDQAAIHTIHGFCGSVLHDNAFESNAPFEAELAAADRFAELLVHDFWRKNLYGAHPLFVSYVINEGKCGIDRLLRISSIARNHYFLRIIPENPPAECASAEAELTGRYVAARDAWREGVTEIRSLLGACDSLNKRSYKPAKVALWLDSSDSYFLSEQPRFPPECVTRFSSGVLRASANKGKSAPEHPYFDRCEELAAAAANLGRLYKDAVVDLKRRLAARIRRELPAIKQIHGVRSFDDLLTGVYEALCGPQSGRLCAAVRARYAAALIDEFQDTDPLQYEIFNRLFGGQSCLFLIGDPKQSIYGFRGADIFSYLKARRDARQRYGLSENWRSEPGLIDGVNAIFSAADKPFLLENINYLRVTPAPDKSRTLLRVEGMAPQPLRLWFLRRESEKQTAKGRAEAAAVEAVIGEIVRLLDGGARGAAVLENAGGARGVCPADIAVLVRTKRQALVMQDALSAAGAPSVLYSNDNVFDSREAKETYRILRAVAEPNNAQWVNAALITDIVGLNANELCAVMEDEAAYERWFGLFHRMLDEWLGRGFMPMFGGFLRSCRVRRRLLGFPDGERRVTNVMHLAEILHIEDSASRRGPDALVQWLAAQLDPRQAGSEEHELRLEKDGNAVRVITIHRSKGLEFPIVFAPFLWDGVKTDGEMVFHDPANAARPTLDLDGENQESRRAAAVEALAEGIRLLYVALTRAKNRCYVLWGNINESQNSPLAYVLGPMHEMVDNIDNARETFKALTDTELLDRLRSLAASAPGAICIDTLPLPAAGPYAPPVDTAAEAPCRTFGGKIDGSWRVTSFSSLTAGQVSDESADRDRAAPAVPAGLQEEAEGSDRRAIASFPRGSTAGNFFHAVLETIDFRNIGSPASLSLITEQLHRHGIDTGWSTAVVDCLTRTVSVPLQGVDGIFTLGDIGPQDRASELEFHLPLTHIDTAALRQTFEGADGYARPFLEQINRLTFVPCRGFMRGFIDLLVRHGDRFYLFDWKSNRLGDAPESYGPEALCSEMLREYYVLQYYLYTAAVDRYLQSRIREYSYETHFGGVFYLFLRGIDPARPELGVVRDRPDPRVLGRLSRLW